MTPILCVIFLVSGTAALLFETLCLLASAPELSGFQTTDRAPWTWLARRLELPDPVGTAP